MSLSCRLASSKLAGAAATVDARKLRNQTAEAIVYHFLCLLAIMLLPSLQIVLYSIIPNMF
ncbi:hypothetical protein MnBA_38590 [Marinobacterium sp. BA1]